MGSLAYFGYVLVLMARLLARASHGLFLGFHMSALTVAEYFRDVLLFIDNIFRVHLEHLAFICGIITRWAYINAPRLARDLACWMLALFGAVMSTQVVVHRWIASFMVLSQACSVVGSAHGYFGRLLFLNFPLDLA